MIGRKDNVRALLILLQNPIFSAQSTYTVFAHVLQVSNRMETQISVLLEFSVAGPLSAGRVVPLSPAEFWLIHG